MRLRQSFRRRTVNRSLLNAFKKLLPPFQLALPHILGAFPPKKFLQVGRKEGQQLEMQNVKNRFFLRCLEKAGLRRIRFHDLRHTFASLLIQNGESLAYVKDQLGHSSIKMTVDVYGHLVPGANRAAVNRLPALSDHHAVSAVLRA